MPNPFAAQRRFMGGRAPIRTARVIACRVEYDLDHQGWHVVRLGDVAIFPHCGHDAGNANDGDRRPCYACRKPDR